MTKSIIFIYIFTLFTTSANLKKFSSELLKVNQDIQYKKHELDNSKKENEIILLKKTWLLNYNYSFSDSSLKEFIPNISGDSKKNIHSISLIKDFEWGGKLVLNNNLNDIFSGHNGIKLFNQSLIYSQDIGANFLGRNFRLSVSSLKEQEKIFNKKLNLEEKIKLNSLIRNYYLAAFGIDLIRIQKEQEKRSKRRFNLVKKHVNEGIKEEIDLLKAQSDLLEQEAKTSEQIKKNDSFLYNISILVHRTITQSEVVKLSKLFYMNKIPKGNLDNNIEVGLLKNKLKLTKNKIRSLNNSILPKLNINASIARNNDTFSDGLLTSLDDPIEYKIGVSLNWALNLKGAKLVRLQSINEEKWIDYTIQKKYENLKLNEKNLIKKINIIDQQLITRNGQNIFVLRALKELERLYRLGRAELDQLLTAEANVSRSQISILNLKMERLNSIVLLNNLYGTLKEFILKDK